MEQKTYSRGAILTTLSLMNIAAILVVGVLGIVIGGWASFFLILSLLGVFPLLLIAFFGSRRSYMPPPLGSQPFHDSESMGLPRQKMLRQIPDGVVLASPWSRIGAFCIDGLAVGVLVIVGMAPMLALNPGGDQSLEMSGPMLVAVVWAFCIMPLALGYMGLRDVVRGASVGRRMMGIRVVQENGLSPARWWKSLIRNLLLGILPLFVIELFYLFANPQYRRFGDQWCKTIVIIDSRY